MEESLFQRFMEVQKKYVEDATYFEGINTHCNPNSDGNTFIITWIKLNAVQFRQQWDNSLCKDCSDYRKCGTFLESDCNRFFNISASLSSSN